MTAPKKSSSQRFPDLYALLGLEPLESDVTVIAAAMQRLQAQLQSQRSKTSDQSAAVRSAKILELGKQQLLHPERKQRYDRQWRQIHSQPMPDKTSVQVAAMPTLVGLLPEGDPSEPFRLHEYTRLAAQKSQRDYAADFKKLRSLLSPTDEIVQEHGSVQQLAVDQRVVLDVMATQAGTPTRDDRNAAAKAWTSTQDEKAAAKDWMPVQASPARLRRKQRERRILWLAIAGLAGLAAVLAVGYRWSQTGQPTGGQAAATTAKLQTPAASPTSDLVRADSTPRRSGLPGVQGIDPNQDLTSNIDDLVPVSPPKASLPENSVEQGRPTVTAASELMATEQQQTRLPETRLPETRAPETVEPNITASAVLNSKQPQLNDAERASWNMAMKQAKQLIGQQQYAAARQQLDANEQLAKTNLQKSQLQRLSQICSLAEEFQQALREAIAGLTAGEVITIGSSTPVGLVDSTEDSITIRMRGENRKFLLTELPIGLAFALSDLAVDMAEAGTLARKAAFAWTHAGAAGSDVASQRAREMLAAAAAAGAVEADLLQIFSDDYQLAAVAMESE